MDLNVPLKYKLLIEIKSVLIANLIALAQTNWQNIKEDISY